jgi:DNA-binding transcriptional LysR family regulator
MRSIPIDVLRAFVAVVEARGFTRAAEDLGRSQPTISLQVKRLEELMEAPLFEKAQRFELTGVGAVCFDYGKRLLRLHDDMLSEATRRKTPEQTLRVGMAGECAARLAAGLPRLVKAAKRDGVEALADDSERIAEEYRRNALDVAFFIDAAGEEECAGRWRARLRWFGEAQARDLKAPISLALSPPDSPLHRTAVNVLRAAGRKLDIACTSPDFSVLAAAVAAGIGLMPMLDGFAPEGVRPSPDKTLPPLPPAVLVLLARTAALAEAGRRWVAEAVKALEPI